MTLSTLESIFSILLSSSYTSEGFTIVWHAGEPLSVPISFYEDAFRLMEKLNHESIPVRHSFQTNATLLTPKWCDFIRKWDVRVGVSIDGPEFIHDKHRVDRSGQGSFDRVIRGVRLLQHNQVPFTVIAVLTKDSLDYPDEIWNFFVDNGILDFGFNMEEIEGVNTKSSLDSVEAETRFTHFFNRIYELRGQCAKSVRVREIDEFSRVIQEGGKLFSSENEAMSIVSFDSTGNISTYSPELLTVIDHNYGRFVFGNVAGIGSLDDILSDEKLIAIDSEIQTGISKCMFSCPYYSLCGGGAPSNKLTENQTFNCTQTLNCKFRVQLFSEVAMRNLRVSPELAKVREQRNGHSSGSVLLCGSGWRNTWRDWNQF